MEDPESEWTTQEYPPSKEGGNTTVRWILDKGYGIGKTMVITGVAISSAPLVLPPLLAFSAIGIAFSVPFGLVFASYACTNKIMDKLLPLPTSSLDTEYYTDEEDEQEEKEWEEDRVEHEKQEEENGKMEDMRQNVVESMYEIDGGDDYGLEEKESITTSDENMDEKGYSSDNEEEGEDGFRSENVMQDEVEEETEDIKQGVEMKFELDEDGEDYSQKEVTVKNLDKTVDGEGYEEDVGEFVDGNDGDDLMEARKERKEEQPSVEIHQVTISVGGNEENNGYIREVEILADGGNEGKVAEAKEDEEIVRGSTRLLESIREEGKVDNALEDDVFCVNESHVVPCGEDVKDMVRTELVAIADMDSQTLVREGTNKGEEPVGEMSVVVVSAGGKEENNGNSRGVEELGLVAKEAEEDSGEEKPAQSEETMLSGSMGLPEENNDSSAGNKHEEASLRRKKENLIYSSGDVRENADKSGSDLVDDRSAPSYQSRITNLERFEVNDEGKETTVEDGADVLDQAPYRAKVASETKKKALPQEALMDEAKIWEQICAMRAIVGYKAISQPTCIAELKALYVFTGVEPPASFEDDSDLAEVNDKLKFLMSIVGVK